MTPVIRALRPLAILCAVAALAAGQGNSETKVKIKRAALESGVVVLDLRVEPTWHIYSVNADGTVGNATKVTVDKPYEISGDVVEPKPHHHKKVWSEDYIEEYDYHEGEITLRIPVKGGAAGPVKGEIFVTSCDANVCLPPGTVKFKAEAASAEGATGAKPAPAGTDTRTSPRATRKVVPNPERLGKFSADDPFKIVEISYPDPIASDRFDVRVVAQIAPEYHIYGLVTKMGTATSFKFAAPGSGSPPVVFSASGMPRTDSAPKLRRKQFEEYDYFDGKVTFDVPARAHWASGTRPDSASEVPFTFHLDVDYQACTMESCLIPATAAFDLVANAIGGPAGLAATTPPEERVTGTNGYDTADPVAAAIATMSFEPKSIQPDSNATIVVRVARKDGKPVVMGDVPPEINLATGANVFVDGAATATPEPDGSVTVRARLKVAPEAVEGALPVSGEVRIGGLTTDFGGSANVVAPLLGFLLLAAGSALFALLTPCVFPMIPVTISFFTKQSETSSRHPAKLALVYSLGIVASFTAIGGLFTALLSGDAANVFAGHWITQLVITALFVFFALSLLGMFDLSVPQPIMNVVDRTTTKRLALASEGKGVFAAVLLMGLLFSITTFTCTAPFIGGLLASASASREFTRPMIGMFVFAAVLAIPFFFLAMFPAQLKRLPKAGGWLNETKVVMGFVELAAAVKFLNGADLALGWNIFTRNVCLALWIAIFGLAGLYLIGVFRLPKDMPRQKTGVLAMMIALILIAITIYLSTGLNGRPLGKFWEGWLPPIERHFQGAAFATGGHGPGASADRTGWDGRFEDDFDGALAEAKKLNLPLFIDFTGYTCANCRAVEAAIFHSAPEVIKLMKGFVVAELHLDGADAVKDENAAIVKRLGLPVAMPTYVALDPRTQKMINWWNWENADPARWEPKVKDTLKRWTTLKQKR